MSCGEVDGAGLAVRRGLDVLRRRGVRVARDSTRELGRATSSLSCLISEVSANREMGDATVGVATSITLSSMSASLSSSIEASAEARTILTLAGSL